MMLGGPDRWAGYYEGDAGEQPWPAATATATVRATTGRTRRCPRQWSAYPQPRAAGIPLPDAQPAPARQYRRVRAELPEPGRALAVDHVRDVLRDYASACEQEGTSRSHTDTTRWTSREIAQQPAVWRELDTGLEAGPGPDRGVPGSPPRSRGPADHPHRRRHLGLRGPGGRAGTGPDLPPSRRGRRHHRSLSNPRHHLAATPDPAGLLRPLRGQPREPRRGPAGLALVYDCPPGPDLQRGRPPLPGR